MKKIGIVIYNYYLGNSLSLLNCATSLAKEGYDVHIFIDSFSFQRSRADFEEDNISVHLIEIQSDARVNDIADSALPKRWNAFIGDLAAERRDEKRSGRRSFLLNTCSVLYGTLQALKSKPNNAIISLRYAFRARGISTPSIKTVEGYTRRFFPFLVEFYQKIADLIDDDYICFVGVEPFGLIAATLAAKATQKEKTPPVIYYNHELMLEKECRTLEAKMEKALERMCNQMCYFTIVQDERRAKYLRDDNDLDRESIICVPVSGLAQPDGRKGTLLQDMYSIPRGKKILLYAGNLEKWAMCVEMAQAAQNWRNDFVLVVHSWREDMKNDPYVNRIRRLTQNNKVYLSLTHVNWEMMPELLSSADVGLVFYQNLGENFYEVGHSSNKLVQYLQAGLPVITSDFPSLREVIDKYQCGECAKGPDEIEQLAEQIFNDYERYRANAFRCYESEYNFAKHFRKVIERIETIEAPLS
jgi:glycosyltransferase involved in cell wall biosynthesis